MVGKKKTSADRVVALVRELLPWQFAKKDIGLGLDLQGDLGMDSLGKVALSFAIEKEFGLDLSAFSGDPASVRTVGDVVAVVESLVADAP